MTMDDDVVRTWAGERPRLLGLAYRLTGSRADAEDLVQEAFGRLAVAEGVAQPAAWLTTVTTRLAIGHLRLSRVQREVYVGPWLPEPVEEGFADPGDDLELAESVSLALLRVMESMTPVERAAFVLHDVFGYSHREVADMLDRSHAAIRQAAARGRRRVREQRPPFEPDRARRQDIAERFLEAARGADLDGLMAVLSPDVVFRSDGGGVVHAARKELVGAERVTKFLLALAAGRPDGTAELAWVNASPALRLSAGGALVSVMALQVGPDGRIAEINAVLNPAKLRGMT